jgi:hypothetical protein
VADVEKGGWVGGWSALLDKLEMIGECSSDPHFSFHRSCTLMNNSYNDMFIKIVLLRE